MSGWYYTEVCLNSFIQVVGIKGVSVLSLHPPFDICAGVVVDMMHCVFLGVIGKNLMKFWFGSAHHAKPFSLRRKVWWVCFVLHNYALTAVYNSRCLCDERLLKILVPHDFSRAPRSLHDLGH